MKALPLGVITTLLTGILLVDVSVSQNQNPTGIDHLSQCIRMAEPLVQNPEFIFPLTEQDIRDVCRMWDGFVDCVHEYTTTYLTPSQREEFNKAIESSIESIQQLCVEDPRYQRKYMAYAPCMKRVSIDNAYCGAHYRYLADLVQTSGATDAQLCCAHQQFRKCVLDTTPRECDAGGVPIGSGNSASQFMRDMLDRALGFLLQKCRESYFNSGDCQADTLNPPGNSLNPDASENPPRPSSSAPPPSDARRSSKSSDEVTPNSIIPNINIAGNGFLGAETQQFRGTGNVQGITPALKALMFTLPLVFML